MIRYRRTARSHGLPGKVRILRIIGIVGIALGIPLATTHAAPLDETTKVCPSDEFVVDWVGPDQPGDRIVIANPDDAPDADPWSFAETSEGNPVTLTAPSLPGKYKKRYLAADPLAVLQDGDLEVLSCAQTCAVQQYPVDRYAVLAHSLQTNTDHGKEKLFKVDDLCAERGNVTRLVRDVIGRAEEPLGVPASVIDAHVYAQLSNARATLCPNSNHLGRVTWSTYIYSACRLSAQSSIYSMDIHVPPGVGDGKMSIADHTSRQIIQVNLQRKVEQIYDATGSGWGSDINLKPIGSKTLLGYHTTGYEFDYQVGLGVGSANVSGTAWLARCIPGINILTAYHDKLTRELQPDAGTLGAYASLVKNQVGMLEHGVPLDITSTSVAKIAGIPGPRATDRNLIIGFKIVKTPADWCTKNLMPTGYEVVDLDQQINQALSGAGGQARGQPGAAGMEDAMKQLNQAMEQMTPEQRAMMESMGIGGGMPTIPGAAPAGGMQPAIPGAAPAATAKPSSARLTTDNLTQTAQLHLQALGYDVGNTNGDLDTNTIIAISEFQADKGLKVTGEVTPQLIGILSAEVDKGQ